MWVLAGVVSRPSPARVPVRHHPHALVDGAALCVARDARLALVIDLPHQLAHDRVRSPGRYVAPVDRDRRDLPSLAVGARGGEGAEDPVEVRVARLDLALIGVAFAREALSQHLIDARGQVADLAIGHRLSATGQAQTSARRRGQRTQEIGDPREKERPGEGAELEGDEERSHRKLTGPSPSRLRGREPLFEPLRAGATFDRGAVDQALGLGQVHAQPVRVHRSCFSSGQVD